jgi:hypothetical protein
MPCQEYTVKTEFAVLCGRVNIEMLENEIKIWRALKEVAPQQVIKSKDSNIPLSTDKIGLLYIDVNVNKQINNFISLPNRLR